MALPQIDLLLHGFGSDYAAGTATAYAAGTSTLSTWYTDSAGTIPAANPYTLSSTGTAVLYCGSRIKVDVKNSAGVSAPGFPIDNLGFGEYLLDNIVATNYTGNWMGHPKEWYVPPGAIMPFAMATCPDGWLKCNGQLLVRASYPELFTAIGTVYATGGEAVTDFRLPDLRGIFIRGFADPASGTGVTTPPTYDAARDTFALTLQAASNAPHVHTSPVHNHAITDAGHAHAVNATSTNGNSYNAGALVPIAGSGATSAAVTGISLANTAVTINTEGTEGRPVNMALLYCIKY